jgi:hypothetical protein
MTPIRTALAAKGLAARRSLALPLRPRQNFSGRATLCGAASKHIARAAIFGGGFGHWGLGFAWNLGIGICRAEIALSAQESDASANPRLWRWPNVVSTLLQCRAAMAENIEMMGQAAQRTPIRPKRMVSERKSWVVCGSKTPADNCRKVRSSDKTSLFRAVGNLLVLGGSTTGPNSWLVIGTRPCSPKSVTPLADEKVR